MWNDCCFPRAAQRQLSQYNRGNIAAVLRAVVTYNKGLKGAKSLPVGVLEEISKFSQNL